MGKRNRAAGQRFEKKVREDLESKGWIVSKWQNNVEWEDVACGGTITNFVEDGKLKQKFEGITPETIMTGDGEIKCGKLVPAKMGRFRTNQSGFPDFIAFEKVQNYVVIESENTSPYPTLATKLFNDYSREAYEIIGVEAKSNGYLSPEEREKCKWLLENNVFSKILIAKKKKVGRKIEVEYVDFEEKYETK